MQKVYVSEEEKEKILDKLSRDIEVRTQSGSSRDVVLTELRRGSGVCFLF